MNLAIPARDGPRIKAVPTGNFGTVMVFRYPLARKKGAGFTGWPF